MNRKYFVLLEVAPEFVIKYYAIPILLTTAMIREGFESAQWHGGLKMYSMTEEEYMFFILKYG